MKALHQVQSARDAADSTQRALDLAKRQTQDATDLVGRAQQRFDQSAAAQYVRGPSPQSLLPSNPEQVISTAATQ